MIKRLIIGILFLFPYGSWVTPGIWAQNTGEEVLLQLPIRVYGIPATPDATPYVSSLKQENFTLRVNDLPRAITSITARKESLGSADTPSTPRCIALSFETAGPDPFFNQAVITFIQQHVRSSDILLIRTPVDLYTINTASNSQQMMENIGTILENDLLQQQRDKTEAIQNLNLLMEGIEFRADKKQLGIRAALLFAGQFLEGWRHYYQQYLLANLESYSTFAARFAEGKGEKYVIHFQERAVSPLITHFLRIAAKLRTYALSLPKKTAKDSTTLLETLDKIERALQLKGDFPMDELLDTLLGVNLHCSVIFLEPVTPTTKAMTPEAPDSSSSLLVGYEKILTTITRQTGGLAGTATDNSAFTALLQKMLHHTDYYYELVYAFDGTVADQNLQVSIAPAIEGVEMYYKKKFRKEELAWLKNRMENTLLTISGITMAGRQLTFVAGGYDAVSQSGKGNLKIEIQLLDSTTTIVYQTSKVMQTHGASVTVSLTLPPQYLGYYQLNIVAHDQTSQQETTATQYIKLE